MNQRPKLTDNLVNSKFECAFLAGRPAEGAKPASVYTDVSRIDMTVSYEVGFIAVFPFSHQGGKSAEGKNVIGFEKSKCITLCQPFSSENFFFNLTEHL